jgi:hypothetical protein
MPGLMLTYQSRRKWRQTMTFGKGALLWLIGIPLPIILLLALFWH